MARRELVIMTRPAALGDFTPGHAMIAVSTAGVGEEAWGFYPDGVKDEIGIGGWERYNHSTVVDINPVQYVALKGAIEQWRNRSYILVYRDCTDFVISVCRQAGITVPRDALWPSNVGKRFVKLHGEGWGQCLAR